MTTNASPAWPWRSMAEASSAVKSGAVSPVELTRACLDRIERADRVLHAFVSVDAETALQAAHTARRCSPTGCRRRMRPRGPG